MSFTVTHRVSPPPPPPPSPFPPLPPPSLPVPQCNSYSLNSIHEFLTQVSQENLLLSWQETLRLVQSLPEGGARKAVTSVSSEEGSVFVCVCV